MCENGTGQEAPQPHVILMMMMMMMMVMTI